MILVSSERNFIYDKESDKGYGSVQMRNRMAIPNYNPSSGLQHSCNEIDEKISPGTDAPCRVCCEGGAAGLKRWRKSGDKEGKSTAALLQWRHFIPTIIFGSEHLNHHTSCITRNERPRGAKDDVNARAQRHFAQFYIVFGLI